MITIKTDIPRKTCLKFTQELNLYPYIYKCCTTKHNTRRNRCRVVELSQWLFYLYMDNWIKGFFKILKDLKPYLNHETNELFSNAFQLGGMSGLMNCISEIKEQKNA